ncbi:MAG: insulinase family protein [Bacteroidetes bacterium]|nr:insulinase family protein [Bacteroidota bacterium]
MRNMTIYGIVLSITILTQISMAQTKTYPFESVPGDPLNARIYTLSNGLKVFMSVNPEAPRIQANICVRAGSKNDPPETTGLAHYFEHMMFKGSEQLGTSNWEAEKKLIDLIEALFEVYRLERDDNRRAAIYRQIDSLSYEASKIAIANEYDKLMDMIGGQGSNAGTSNDYTVYIENIPSNQIENWAKIQADRFDKPVLRIFHTELETVYEEKNRSLTSDSRKVGETTLKALFPNHPYGRQTTLGESEHLKNPSMKNIREFFNQYYVPNNMAIVMAGDFDPDQTIAIIDKYFSKLKPGTPRELRYDPFEPLAGPVENTITGLEAENIQISFGLDAKASSHDAMVLQMIGSILSNGKAGIIDANLKQKQLVLSAYAYASIMNDYAYLSLNGRPRAGQTLEELRDLLLQQVDLLKKGEFPDWMITAAINNEKVSMMRQFETNNGRAMEMAGSFFSNIPWKQTVAFIDEYSKITKEEVISFARKHFGENYVTIYKRQGTPEEVEKMSKPPITPVHLNYTDESEFLKGIRNASVAPIQPVFLDYQKDLAIKRHPSGVRVVHNINKENDLFTLTYYFAFGKNDDKAIPVALKFLPYLGTSKKTAEEIQQELYKLACDLNINSREEQITITLSGLGENFEKAWALLEDMLADCQPDQIALDNLVDDIIKGMENSKSNQQEVFNALVSYGTFGEQSPLKHILTAAELNGLQANDVVAHIRGMTSINHQILYYGPLPVATFENLVSRYHKVPKSLKPAPKGPEFKELTTDVNKVVFAPYDARQTRLQTIIRSDMYNPAMTTEVNLYDTYMRNLSFRELREKRALAYTAYALYQTPPESGKPYMAIGFIGTQNDKMMDAFHAMNELYDAIPLSQGGFETAKETILSKIRTERISRMNIIWNLLDAERHGLQQDIRKEIYAKVQQLQLDDIKRFNEKFIKNKTKTYLVLGRESELDFDGLAKFGTIKKLTLEDIFGY